MNLKAVLGELRRLTAMKQVIKVLHIHIIS